MTLIENDTSNADFRRRMCAQEHKKSIPEDILEEISDSDKMLLDRYEAVVFEYLPHKKRVLIENGCQQGLFVKRKINDTKRNIVKPRPIPYVGRLTGGKMVDLHAFLMSGDMLNDE